MSQKPLYQITDAPTLRIMVCLLRAENSELRELIRTLRGVSEKTELQQQLKEDTSRG